MSYERENLYIVTRGDKKAYKSAATLWMWEDGAFIGFIPIFTIAATAWAVGSRSLPSIIVAGVLWVIEIGMFNLHELYRTVRRGVYLRSGRILKVPDALRAEFLRIIPTESYGVPRVEPETLRQLGQAFADFRRSKKLSPDRGATYEARRAAGEAQLRHILGFELEDRAARAAQHQAEVQIFNSGQAATARMYTDD